MYGGCVKGLRSSLIGLNINVGRTLGMNKDEDIKIHRNCNDKGLVELGRGKVNECTIAFCASLGMIARADNDEAHESSETSEC